MPLFFAFFYFISSRNTLKYSIDNLISHNIAPEEIDLTVAKIAARIKQPYLSVNQQLDLLKQLGKFDFGRFMLQHQGLNGYWTHYALANALLSKNSENNIFGEPLTELEDFLLNKAPVTLATQQRFKIFLKENQNKVIDKAKKVRTVGQGFVDEVFRIYKNKHPKVTIEYTNANDDVTFMIKRGIAVNSR